MLYIIPREGEDITQVIYTTVPNHFDTLYKLKKIFSSDSTGDTTPKTGCIIMCNLAVGFEHTGIYIGNNQIIHRSGDGYLETVTPSEFLSRLDGFNPAITLYFASTYNYSFKSSLVAERAKQALKNPNFKGYNLLDKNCHQFTKYCLTGEKDTFGIDFTFTSLEILLRSEFDIDKWKIWRR